MLERSGRGPIAVRDGSERSLGCGDRSGLWCCIRAVCGVASDEERPRAHRRTRRFGTVTGMRGSERSVVLRSRSTEHLERARGPSPRAAVLRAARHFWVDISVPGVDNLDGFHRGYEHHSESSLIHITRGL